MYAEQEDVLTVEPRVLKARIVEAQTFVLLVLENFKKYHMGDLSHIMICCRLSEGSILHARCWCAVHATIVLVSRILRFN